MNPIRKVKSVIKLIKFTDNFYEIQLELDDIPFIELKSSLKQLDNLRHNFKSQHITYIVYSDTEKRLIWSSRDDVSFLEKTFNGELIKKQLSEKKDIITYPLKPKTKPFPFQLITSSMAITQKRYGFFLEQGLGKTKVSLDAACYLLKEKLIEKVIVYAPGGLVVNWEHEIAKNVYKTYQSKFLIESNSLLSFNPRVKKVPLFVKFLDKIQNGKYLIIFDEFHYFKNPDSKRTKYILDNLTYKSLFFLLTGTPCSKGIVDLFVTFKLFNIIEGNYYQFLNNYFLVEDTKFGKKIKDEYTAKTELLLEKLKQYSSWIKKDDVLDLPEKNFNVFYYKLNPAQDKLIKSYVEADIKKLDPNDKDYQSKLNILKTGRIESAKSFGFNEKQLNEVFSRILQIQSGFYLDADGKRVELKENNKLTLLLEIINSINEDEPIIIFCSFTYEVEAIEEKLLNLGYGVITRHGKLNKKKKNKAISDFVENNARILVATTASTGTGFTLINSNNIIYYSNLFGIQNRLQSEDRIHRIGQTRTCNYYDLIAENSLDEIILNYNKKNEQKLNNLFKTIGHQL